MKKLLTRQRLRKLLSRYEYRSIEFTVLYPVHGTPNIFDTVVIIHPSRGKKLLRYDNREKKWQLFWPIIEPVIGRNRKPMMKYTFRKFRWTTLTAELQFLINRQLDTMTMDVELTLDYGSRITRNLLTA